MTELVAEELVREALARLTPHDDPRVRVILEGATVTVDEATDTWEASAGTVVARRVHVGVSAEWIEVLRSHPHLEDAIVRVLASVFTTRPRESLSDVRFHEATESPPVNPSPYRSGKLT